MKLVRLLVLISFSTLLFTSCGKDEDGNEEESIIPKISATVDGVEWSCSVTVVGTAYSDYLTFVGTKLDGSKMLIAIKMGEVINEGTYDIDLNPVNSQGNISLPTAKTGGVYFGVKDANNPDAAVNYFSKKGSVKITKVSKTGKTIAGTFSFTAINKNKKNIEITNGKFSNVLIVKASTPSE